MASRRKGNPHVVVGHPIAELTKGGKVKEMEKPKQRHMKHAVVVRGKGKAVKECKEEEDDD